MAAEIETCGYGCEKNCEEEITLGGTVRDPLADVPDGDKLNIATGMTGPDQMQVGTCRDITANTEPDECVICLDRIGKRGQIKCCDHKFCFGCIKKWSKVTNKCPVCKRIFNDITRVIEANTKGKRKRAPEVVQVPNRSQRSDMYNPPPINPSMMRTSGLDIRDIMRFFYDPHAFTNLYGLDEDEDSDYVEDEDRELDAPARQRRRRERGQPGSSPVHVLTQELFENGHTVIEILDDEEDRAMFGTNASLHPSRRRAADGAVATPGARHSGSRSSRGPRGHSLLQPTESSQYVVGAPANAAPSTDRIGFGSDPVVVNLTSDNEDEGSDALGVVSRRSCTGSAENPAGPSHVAAMPRVLESPSTRTGPSNRVRHSRARDGDRMEMGHVDAVANLGTSSSSPVLRRRRGARQHPMRVGQAGSLSEPAEPRTRGRHQMHCGRLR